MAEKYLRLFIFSKILGWHHGTLDYRGSVHPSVVSYPTFLNTEKVEPLGRPSTYEQLRIDFCSDAIARHGSEMLLEIQAADEMTSLDDVSIGFLSGLVTLADWIGSTEKYFPPDAIGMTDSEIEERARNAVADIGFSNPVMIDGLLFQDIFKNGNGSSMDPNPMQSAIGSLKCGPGDVIVIEAPMGMGKTEAALWLSYLLSAQGKNRGIYFALPTQLTSNKMFDRFSGFVSHSVEPGCDALLKLAHSNSWLEDDSLVKIFSGSVSGVDSGDGESFFNSCRRSLFASFGVGTLDQAMMAEINVKHQPVRIAGLAGKVVIIDEVHSYDVYTGTILVSFIRKLQELGCTVIILSATLTKSRKAELLGVKPESVPSDGYPLITVLDRATRMAMSMDAGICIKSQNVKIRLERRVGGSERLISHAVDMARQGHCVVWFRNTVREAQKLYRKIKSASCGGFEVGLLHSRFTYLDRDSNETKWIGMLGKEGKRPNGCILVTTQVAEQSLDIDADHMISDFCPIDMLLQRIGRLHRHNRPDRKWKGDPEIIIETMDQPLAEVLKMNVKSLSESFYQNRLFNIYDKYIMLRTWMVLEGVGSISVPGDIRKLLESVYEPYTGNDLLEQLRRESMSNRSSLESRARNASRKTSSEASDDEGTAFAKTRYSEYESVPVLVVDRYSVSPAMVSFRLLDGSEHTVIKGASFTKETMETKKAINRNVVRVPPGNALASQVDSRDKDSWDDGGWVRAEKFLGQQCAIMEVNDINRICETKLARYTSNIGMEMLDK
jgi:CRISPR-associated endonuclease/helicase Cas3